jgi:hypothetical protein
MFGPYYNNDKAFKTCKHIEIGPNLSKNDYGQNFPRNELANSDEGRRYIILIKVGPLN